MSTYVGNIPIYYYYTGKCAMGTSSTSFDTGTTSWSWLYNVKLGKSVKIQDEIQDEIDDMIKEIKNG